MAPTRRLHHDAPSLTLAGLTSAGLIKDDACRSTALPQPPFFGHDDQADLIRREKAVSPEGRGATGTVSPNLERWREGLPPPGRR